MIDLIAEKKKLEGEGYVFTFKNRFWTVEGNGNMAKAKELKTVINIIKALITDHD